MMKMWLLGMMAAVGLACGSESADVQCEQNANCNLEPGGACETYAPTGSRWCTYPDSTCPSGRRWSDFDTGDGLSDMCVGDEQAVDAGADASVADASGSLDGSPDANTEPDASMTPDAGPPLGTWGAPEVLANVNGLTDDLGPAISHNGLELYYARPKASEPNDIDILVATRASVATAFGAGQPVAAVNTSGIGAKEFFPFVTADGLELYFERLGSPTQIYVSKRTTTASAWQSPVAVFAGRDPSLTSDKLEIYYRSQCPNNYPCIFRRTRATPSGAWSAEEMVQLPSGVHGDGSSSMNFQFVHVSPDGLGLLLSGPFSASASRVVQVWRPNRSSNWSSSTLLVINSLAFEVSNAAARWNHDLTEIYLSADPATGGVGEDDIYVSRLQ